MGSAIADRLVASGLELTLWNRSASRIAPYARRGIHTATAVVQAIGAADVVVVCLLDDEATRDCLLNDAVGAVLSEKLLVQLSSVTAAQSQALARWVNSHDCGYVDGQIQDYPDTLRDARASIVCSGSNEAYRRAEPVLSATGSRLIHVGEQPGNAATLVNAQLSFCILAYVGALQGLALCQRAKVSPTTFVETLLLDYVRKGAFVEDLEKMMRDANGEQHPDSPGAALEVWQSAFQLVIGECQSARLEVSHLDAIDVLFGRAIGGGYGKADIAALIKSLTT